MAQLSSESGAELAACLQAGGVALFPSDTVYGLCCDPACEPALKRLYALKGRPARQPAAVMYFALEPALWALGALDASEALGERTLGAVEALLPGPVTLLLANPGRRFPLACADDPTTLGLRVPALPPPLAALRAVAQPLLQSSANLSGGPAPLRVADVPASIRERVDLVLDGGELPGVASTVLDLRSFEHDGSWSITRPGALAHARAAALLSGL